MPLDSLFSVAILGAGASGLACSIEIKRRLPEADVFLYEKMSEPGRKILATGNGRCNLSNKDVDISYYNGDSSVISTVLSQFSADNAVHFFDSLGVIVCEEEGRIYPRSRKSENVLSALTAEAVRLGVNIITGCRIEDLEKKDDKFIISSQNGSQSEADCAVIALGGKAASVYGTDGDGYRLIRRLGISYSPIFPALVQITVSEPFMKNLKGIRVHGSISLFREDGTFAGMETGEIQLTDYGISGIPSMQLSGETAVLCKSEHPLATLDFMPEISELDLLNFLRRRQSVCKGEPACSLVQGILVPALAEQIFKTAGISCAAPSDSLSVDSIVKLTETIKSFTLTPTGTKGFRNAQVTRGGVSGDELLPGTLQSRKVPGLFFCGEILNADGACGGYNLHFAWGSGIKAAKDVVDYASHK